LCHNFDRSASLFFQISISTVVKEKSCIAEKAAQDFSFYMKINSEYF